MLIRGKRVLAICILSCFLIQTISVKTDVLRPGNLSYSSFLSIGKELEWQISTLDWTGNESVYYDMNIENFPLSQGDKIKLKVTQDPNTLFIDLKAEGDWLNISINGDEKKYNPFDVHLGDHTWDYGDFFTSPAIYEQEDEFDLLFKDYYNHVKPTEYNDSESYSDIGDEYSVTIINEESLLFNISDAVFIETFYYCEYFEVIDNRYEDEEESLFKLYSVFHESIIDIERGTLYSYKCNIDYVYNYTSEATLEEYIEDHYYFSIENLDKTNGYEDNFATGSSAETYDTFLGININYVVVGMAIFTAAVAIFERIYNMKKKSRLKQIEKKQIDGFAERIRKVLQPQEEKTNDTISAPEASQSNLSK